MSAIDEASRVSAEAHGRSGSGGPSRPRSLEDLGPSRGGAFTQIWAFLRENKKWWLLPILICLLLFGALLVLAGTGAAPFIYTVF
jgi:hypothetical protein